MCQRTPGDTKESIEHGLPMHTYLAAAPRVDESIRIENLFPFLESVHKREENNTGNIISSPLGTTLSTA